MLGNNAGGSRPLNDSGPVNGAFHAKLLAAVGDDHNVEVEVDFEMQGKRNMIVDGNSFKNEIGIVIKHVQI